MSAMLDLLAKVIALGVASTASPVIFGITLSLLAGREHGRERAAALLGGGVASVLVLLAMGAVAGSHLSGYGAEIRAQAKAIDLSLAVLFLLFAGISLFSGDRAGAPRASGRGGGALKWLALGFALNITNLDAVLLLLTEAKEIFQSAILMPEKLALMCLGACFFLLPTLLPLAVYVLRPGRAARALEPVGAFMGRYGRYLAAAVFLGFGVYLAWRGLM